MAVAMNSITRNVFSPKPMCLPRSIHLLDRYALCLRQKVKYENSHCNNECSEEEEKAEFHVAKHGEKKLSNDESEEHVDRNIDGLPCGSDL